VKDRSDVVVESTVVVAAVPGLADGVGQIHDFCRLERNQALVGQAQRIVVHDLVHVSLVLEQLDHGLIPPDRPGVRAVMIFDVATPTDQRFVEVACEVPGVAGARPADGLDVVHGVVGILAAGE
jgi:hypothetical protein